MAEKPSMPPAVTMMQMLNGMVVSRCISLAADLGIADQLAAGARGVDELAAETESNADGLYRVLRTLSGLGIFVELPDRRFENSPLSETLRSDVPGSVRAISRWLGHPLHWKVISDLDHSVRTGEPSILKGHTGKAWYEVFAADESAQAVFSESMTGVSKSQGPPILAAYDFSRFARITDVGGGHGILSVMIAKAAPQATITLVDLPHVVQGATPILEEAGLTDRIKTVGASILETVPGPTDLCVLKWILHLWSDEVATRILENCRKALEPGGHIAVCEMLVGPGPTGVPARIMDIEMLTGPGGRERTEADFARLFEAAGFKLERVIDTPTPVKILEGVAT